MAKHWELQNWGLAGVATGGIVSVAAFPATIAGAIAGSVIISVGGTIGVLLGVTKKAHDGGKEVSELGAQVSVATADLYTSQ